MTFRTVVTSSFEEYIASEVASPEVVLEETQDRQKRLQTFPYAVMLQLAFPELDNAERWCWEHFGPMHGECRQSDSHYRVCLEEAKHAHTGKWATNWFGKTDYDFGFHEFYFAQPADCEAFREHLPELNWGERFTRDPLQQ